MIAPFTTRKSKKTSLGPVRTHRFVGKKGIRGRNGTGSVAFIPVPLRWRQTTRQLCGFYPWSAPGALPMVGGPIGRHTESKAVVCFDHINYFLHYLIANPSLLIIAKPGLGKSTCTTKIALNLAAQGYIPVIPGDTKPDYVNFVRALGGEIRSVSRSGGAALNPCDPGGMAAAAKRIGGAAGAELLAEAIGRATVCIATLIELGRSGQAVEDYEKNAVNKVLWELYENNDQEPLLRDVEMLLAERPAAVRAAVVDQGDDATYDRLIGPLRRSLLALVGGEIGDVFSRRVTRSEGQAPAFCLDTSSIKSGDPKLLASVLVAGWSDTYGMVEANQALANAGLAERALYCLILDELWRVLQLGGTMPDRVDELTRLNRTEGIGQIFITHTVADLKKGMQDRMAALMIGGVPKSEIELLDQVMTLTRAERQKLLSWWSQSSGAQTGRKRRFGKDKSLDREGKPPGAGLFLLKTSSEDPGIPVEIVLSSEERKWGGQNTNKTWEGRAA